MSLRLLALTVVIFLLKSSLISAADPSSNRFIKLQKGAEPSLYGKGDLKGDEINVFDALAKLKWEEPLPVYISLSPTTYSNVLIEGTKTLHGVVLWKDDKTLREKLLPKARGQIRWLEEGAFLMASNEPVLDKFMVATGQGDDPSKLLAVIKGSGMTYVVDAKSLNEEQKKHCLHNNDTFETTLKKLKARSEFRKEAAYNLWELMGFPLDTPIRFYRAKHTNHLALLLHDTLKSYVSFDKDKVAVDFEKNTREISPQDVELAIQCFYTALNNSEKEIKALLRKTGVELTSLDKNATDEQLRQAMATLFVDRVMMSQDQMAAGMDLAAEISKTIKGDLLDDMTKTLTKQVKQSFAKITEGMSKKEKKAKKEAGQELFNSLHAAFIGYFIDDVGIQRSIAKFLGHWFDDRAYVLNAIFEAAKAGLD